MSENNSRFTEFLARALEVPAGERTLFIESNCEDPDLREELIELLAKEAELGTFLERPAARAMKGGEQTSPFETGQLSRATVRALPETVGPFRIRELLGEGGMGVVYLAEQDEPVKRELAIKVVRAELTGENAYQRFAGERQALARLSHRYIAQMYEAGATEDGFPYFAMELVRGVPITTYCDHCQMAIEERLELFVQVCQGVQHAHQRGIIHRDLKPSNILVSEVEGRAVPKLIDFGIAKALDRPLTDITQLTGLDAIGTPAYMSPESLGIDDDANDPDTRTDVYALGVVLYELLAGVQPFDSSTRSVAQFVKRMMAEDAPRPSVKLAALDDAQRRDVSANRGLAAETLPRRVTGDLDWITARAIAKERDQRYGSAAELAEDIERHLHDEPVKACPPSARYLARKFVRRHRAAAAATVLILAALLLGVFGTSLGMVQASREAERANREAAAATEVSQFLSGMFRVSDPSVARGNSITARELLDQGAERIGSDLAGQPLLQARMMDLMGTTYAALGLYDESIPLLEQALELRKSLLGEAHIDLALSLNNLAIVMKDKGEYDAAEPLYRESLDMRRRLLGNDHSDVSESLNDLALLLSNKGEYETAAKLYRESLEIIRRLFGNEHPDVATGLNNLGLTLRELGDYDEAENLHREALAMRRRLLGNDHPRVASSINNLALTLSSKGDFDAAEPLSREAVELCRRLFGNDHPNVATSLNDLALLLTKKGDYLAAEPLYRESLAIRRRLLGNDHPEVAVSLASLARVLSRTGNYDAAEPLCREALAMFRRLLGDDHPYVAINLIILADLENRRGRHAAAEAPAREAMTILQQAFAPGHQRIAKAEFVLGAALAGLGRYAEAEPLLVTSLETLRVNTGEDSSDTQQVRQELEALYTAWGKPAGDAELR